mgnify:FL=1
MTTPSIDPALEAMLPKAVVLQPAWNDMTARVMNSYQEETSDPTHRFIIPKGISVILVENSSRFTVTLKILRGSTEMAVGTVPTSAAQILRVSSEESIEAFLALSLSPNTNDRLTTRIGVQIITTP